MGKKVWGLSRKEAIHLYMQVHITLLADIIQKCCEISDYSNGGPACKCVIWKELNINVWYGGFLEV